MPSFRAALRCLAATLLLALAGSGMAQSCPVPGGVDGGLVVQLPDGTRRPLDAAALARLPPQQRVQRRSVAAPAASSGDADVQQSIGYAGVLLRDAISAAAPELLDSRAARGLVFEAVATDRYIAAFSWGELFNAAHGEQTLIVRSQDGRPLDASAGPLALRALGDLRPGPRHVRNLCAVVIRRVGPG